MSAITEDRSIEIRQAGGPMGRWVQLPVAAGATIHQNSWVGLDANGYLVSYTSPTIGLSLVGGTPFVGLTLEGVDNSGGEDGAATCKVLVDGEVQHTLAGVAVTDVGAPVFVANNGDLSKLATAGLLAGRVVRHVAADTAMIRIASPFGVADQGIISRLSGVIDVTAANVGTLIYGAENQSGLLVLAAGALVTTEFAGGTQDQAEITLKHSAGATSMGIVLTGADGGASIGTLLAATNTVLDASAAAGDALVIVPAGMDLSYEVTQPVSGIQAAGAAKIFVMAIPIA